MKKVKRVRSLKSKIKSVRELKKGERVREDSDVQEKESSSSGSFTSSGGGQGEILGSVSAAGRGGALSEVSEATGSRNRDGDDERPTARLYAGTETTSDNERRTYAGTEAPVRARRIVARDTGGGGGRVLGSGRMINQPGAASGDVNAISSEQFTERRIFNDEGRVDRYYEGTAEENMRVKRRGRMF